MLTLALVGLIGGLITGISPCMLPVLPVVLLSGTPRADGRPASRWRPWLVIAGLIVSFTLATLFGALLLAALGLPLDLIRWAGIVVLAVIGIGLLVPGVERLLERPFAWIPRREVATDRGGFGLGLAVGAVMVPCAGPVLAAITVAGSTGRVDAGILVLTGAFAVGVAIPLLVFALAGQQVWTRVRAFAKRQRGIRIVAGVAVLALAVGIALDLPQVLQRAIPDYTTGLQQTLDESDSARRALTPADAATDENRGLDACENGATELQQCGPAPEIRGIQQWFNTDAAAEPGAVDAPQATTEPTATPTIAGLRGNVVLIDFWTYACINCQRALPHVTAWAQQYRDAGLRVIGVHSPEYAFEHEPANVAAAITDFGIDYPVALDNDLETWRNYRNRYWPAQYLIDAEGVVRHVRFGEGDYGVTERLIRELLAEADAAARLPAETDVADRTPRELISPETYLGTQRQSNFAGEEPYESGEFAFPRMVYSGTFALDGEWTLGAESIEPAGDRAGIRLTYSARTVQLVASGSGTIELTVDGVTTLIEVGGVPGAIPLRESSFVDTAMLDLVVPRGVQLFAFTFG